MIFVNSMSDLFHKAIPYEYIRDVFRVMLWENRHTYQILTKRPARAAAAVPDILEDLDAGPELPPHIWIGTSIENQQVVYRVSHLLAVPACIRFLSCEPLIGPLELGLVAGLGDGPRCRHCGCATVEDAESNECGCDEWPCGPAGLDWVIVGGESGSKARPMHVSWARSIVRECKHAGVPVFVKQLGANVRDRNDAGFLGDAGDDWDVEDLDRIEHDPDGSRDGYQGAPVRVRLRHPKGGDPTEWPEDLRIREMPVIGRDTSMGSEEEGEGTERETAVGLDDREGREDDRDPHLADELRR